MEKTIGVTLFKKKYERQGTSNKSIHIKCLPQIDDTKEAIEELK
jgi:hypothetical protein